MNEIGNLFMSLENTPLVGINEWIKKNNADEIILYEAGINSVPCITFYNFHIRYYDSRDIVCYAIPQ